MDQDDRPRASGDMASRLASESLDSLSQDELAQRIRCLEVEIDRTRSHMERVAAHRHAADSLFRPPAS